MALRFLAPTQRASDVSLVGSGLPGTEIAGPDSGGTSANPTGQGSTGNSRNLAPSSRGTDVPATSTSGLLSGTSTNLQPTDVGIVAQIAGAQTLAAPSPPPNTGGSGTSTNSGTGVNTGQSGTGLDQSLLNLVASMYAGGGNPADSSLGGLFAGPVGPATGADAPDAGAPATTSSGLSGNAKILIVALIGVAVWYWWKHHKKKKAP